MNERTFSKTNEQRIVKFSQSHPWRETVKRFGEIGLTYRRLRDIRKRVGVIKVRRQWKARYPVGNEAEFSEEYVGFIIRKLKDPKLTALDRDGILMDAASTLEQHMELRKKYLDAIRVRSRTWAAEI